VELHDVTANLPMIPIAVGVSVAGPSSARIGALAWNSTT
jgi:hypothetical protein